MTEITSNLTLEAKKIDILLNAQKRLNDYSDYCSIALKIDNRFLLEVLKNAVDAALTKHKMDMLKLAQEFVKK